ncbi:MAG: 3-deoxy-D-manno-octulosonic acid transferase [Rhodocyclaceae bacterium]|nr:3-deoxy-D-manno-octulosonic acid transferase [Rhodocyclaceae bacterium]
MPVARLLYTALLVVALPLAVVFLLWRGRRHPGYRRHWRERFLGLAPAEVAGAPGSKLGTAKRPPGATEGSRPLVWIHAVSVGETRAAQPLVEALLSRQPGVRVLLTHGTPTGREAGTALFGDRVARAYLPYDLPWALKAFLQRHRPALGLLIETEIWPNLVHACHSQGVALCLVNARLSERSARGYRRLAWLARPAFAGLTRALAQTVADAGRLTALGVRDTRVTGNLKSDADPDARQVARGRAWRAAWDAEGAAAGMPPRAVWLAASTREGEDEAVIEAARHAPAGALLLWAPRHPHRVAEIERALDHAGLTHLRRTASALPGPQVAVWIGDTLGELAAYIAAADVVFVGGSLVPLGGQNLLEACAQGKPVLTGPHTFNFEELSAAALAAGAALRVANGTALGAALRLLLADAESAATRRAAMGAAGKLLQTRGRGALQKTLAGLEDLLPPVHADGGASPGSGSSHSGTR